MANRRPASELILRIGGLLAALDRLDATESARIVGAVTRLLAEHGFTWNDLISWMKRGAVMTQEGCDERR